MNGGGERRGDTRDRGGKEMQMLWCYQLIKFGVSCLLNLVLLLQINRFNRVVTEEFFFPVQSLNSLSTELILLIFSGSSDKYFKSTLFKPYAGLKFIQKASWFSLGNFHKNCKRDTGRWEKLSNTNKKRKEKKRGALVEDNNQSLTGWIKSLIGYKNLREVESFRDKYVGVDCPMKACSGTYFYIL